MVTLVRKYPRKTSFLFVKVLASSIDARIFRQLARAQNAYKRHTDYTLTYVYIVYLPEEQKQFACDMSSS